MSDTLNRDRILELAKKLMNVSENKGATPAEVANAMAALQGILLKHNLTMLDVSKVELEKNHAVKEEFFVSDYQSLPGMYSHLVKKIAEGFGVKIILDKHYAKQKIIFIGQELDCITARYLYHRCGDDLWKMAQQEAKVQRLSGKQVSRFRENYILAAAEEIGKRLLEARQQSESENRKVGALMVLKTNMISEYVQKTYPSLRKGKKYYISEGIGTAEGRDAGRNMDLSIGRLDDRTSTPSRRLT